MTVIRPLLIATTLLGVIGVYVALAGALAGQAGYKTPENEALYLERWDALAGRTGGSGLGAYDPLKPVPGAADWEPLPRRAAADRLIPADALAEAKDYAAANNSSAFMVWKDGAIEAEVYYGDFDRKALIVSKSLAKPLGVIAVGRAIEEGHIESLDQPVADFITEWRDTPKEDIRLRHLLAMRSGLLAQGAARTPDHVLNRAYLHPAHVEVIIHEYPLVNEPGSRYDYSNANGELVAPVIERATGMAYEDWLSEAVFEPLGAMGGEIWMNREGGTPHSGCCILLPAETYLRMALLYLREGMWDGQRLLPKGYVDKIRERSPDKPHAGMGLYLGSPYIERRGAAHPEIAFGKTFHSEPYAADDLYLFDGNANQVVYIVPSHDLIVLRTGGRPPEQPEWDNARLPNAILEALTTSR